MVRQDWWQLLALVRHRGLRATGQRWLLALAPCSAVRVMGWRCPPALVLCRVETAMGRH